MPPPNEKILIFFVCPLFTPRNMKLKLILFSFFYSFTFIYAATNNLYRNFAEALFTPNPGEYIIMFTRMDNPLAFKNPITNKKIVDFSKKDHLFDFLNQNYPIEINVTLGSICKEVPTIFFIWEESSFLWDKQEDTSAPLLSANIWIAILKSPYNHKGEMYAPEFHSEDKLAGLKKFPSIINPENFFYIPHRNSENIISLSWNEEKSKPYLKTFASANAELFGDLKQMSLPFCSGEKNYIQAVQIINTLIPELKTALGKEIAKAGIELFEQKIIAQEFPNDITKEQHEQKDAALKQLHERFNDSDFTPRSGDPEK